MHIRGHDDGAENWACIASLIETCKLNGVDPQTLFTDVLTKLVNLWPHRGLMKLMPWAWAESRASHHSRLKAPAALVATRQSSAQSRGERRPLTFSRRSYLPLALAWT